jgi:hypothetical protein
MEQLGEKRFGENREYVIKTIDPDHRDYDHLHGYLSMTAKLIFNFSVIHFLTFKLNRICDNGLKLGKIM